MQSLNPDNTPYNASLDLEKYFSRDTTIRNFANLFLGLLGVAIIIPLLLPFRVWVLFSTRQLYRKILKDANKVYENISTMSESEVLDIHLHYEKLKNHVVPEMNNIVTLLEKEFSNSYLANYMKGYIIESGNIILNLENDLKTAAYPNLDKPLSEDQLQELLKAYHGVDTADWEDLSESYKKAYL